MPQQCVTVTHFSSLEIGSLSGNHFSQQLLLQSVLGHSEIDEGGLGLHLRLVVRIGQFGLWCGETIQPISKIVLVSNRKGFSQSYFSEASQSLQ